MANKSSSLRVQTPKSTDSAVESPAYAGLESAAGIRAVACPSLPDMACPFCASTDLAFVMGKVSFCAMISGDDLFDGKSQSLVTVVCSKSHFFFLRENDILWPTTPLAA
jgi:hypothetical protein